MAVTQNGPKQKNRHLSLETPLGTDVLVLRGLEGHEQLSKPFQLELDALSTDPAIAHKDILGQNVTVTMDLADDKKRYFNGFVSRFELHGYDGQFAHYRAVVVPWLWFLTRTTDCRIFQNKSIPDIIQGIFREHGFTDFEDALSGSYEAFEYVTQYRETDFDFVSRLMEQEGIYYFFRHEEHKHTLVLADSYDAHQACPDYEKIPFYPPDSQKAVKEDYVWDWQTRQAVRPGTFALNDYDFTAPKKKLRTAANITRDYEYADYEMYDYPGGYTDKGVGNQYSQARIEERQTDFDTCQGQGNVRGLLAGGLTTLTKHPGEAHNREYLLTAVTHHVESDSMETGRNEAQDRFYRCEFDLIDAKTQFRPPLATPKGIVRGPQTAVVVGKSGEDIWTDKYGRVKVQFHWDREGQNNEKSSCWVRVSQLWAGKNWGGMHIPHIGQEVIVDFLEGDPDRPIITGRVYNGDNMPPEELPTQKTKSIIRDYGANEMVWEGKQDKRFIRINQDCGNQLVMNDEPGREGVWLSDKFGNMLLMDAANELITMRSPSTTSALVLGEGTQGFTGKDSFKFTGGVTTGVTVGSKTLMTAGTSLGVNVGHKMGVMAGMATNITLGHTLEYTKGSKLSYGDSASYSKFAKSTTLDADEKIVLDAGEAVWIMGGENDAAQVKADAKSLWMSYSEGSGKRACVDLAGGPPIAAMAVGIGTSLAGVGAKALAEHAGDAAPKRMTRDDSPESGQTAAETATDVATTVVGLLAGVYAFKTAHASAKKGCSQQASRQGGIKEHSPSDACVRLNKSGVLIKAGQGKAVIHLGKNKGHIGMHAEKDVVIGTKTCKVKADLHVTGKGFIKNKNIKVEG